MPDMASFRSARSWFLAAAAFATSLALCQCREQRPHAATLPAAQVPVFTPISSAAPAFVAPAPPACAARVAAVAAAPALSELPQVEALRAELLGRARAEPVLFLSAPLPEAADAASRAWRARLFGENPPYTAFTDVLRAFKRDPEALRRVVLTDGYLYADEPTLGTLLATRLSLSLLFREPLLQVTRGSQQLKAERRGASYVWVDGPDAGAPARLWLFDRVSVLGAQLGPSRHVAVRRLAEELGTSSIELVRHTAGGLLASLSYDELRIPAVLQVAPTAELLLECELVTPAEQARVTLARHAALRRRQALGLLRSQIEAQVSEGLPFDEPKTEEGQQDGKLRPEWRNAYLRGETSFLFNGDRYSVFDDRGRPRTPQVCVDFVVDTWERVAGTRWLAQSEGRARSVGRLDFGRLGIENRRSVEQLIEFARAHPEWFELLEVPEAARVPFAQRRRFFERLYRQRQDFRPGDVVAILGPRDDEKLHYHSFFIVDHDPVSGMPTLLAANAGRPRLRTWEAELENAPRRGVVARIRPRLSWLEALGGGSSIQPAPG